MKHHFISIFALVSANCLPVAIASPLPEGISYDNSIFLPANSKSTPTVPLPVLKGGLTNSSAEKVIESYPDMVVLRSPGHHNSTAQFDYTIDDSVKPGAYAFWTDFTQGGKATQNFKVSVGSDTTTSTEQLTFSQSSPSWQMEWRKAANPIYIFSQDTSITVNMEGDASQQKQAGGFLLEKVAELPKDFQQVDFQARKTALSRFNDSKAPAMLVMMSAEDNPAGMTPLYQELNKSEDLEGQFELVVPSNEISTNIRQELGLSPQAWVLLIQTNLAIDGMWEGPFTADSANAIVTALQDPNALKPMPIASLNPQDAHENAVPMQDGRPQAWLTLGFWAGPAGLSLWGMDYESNIRPNLGAPCLVSRFDRVYESAWTAEPLLADVNAYGNAPMEMNSVWPKGTSYAHLYVYAPEAETVQLHLAQTGIMTEGWCNGEAMTFTIDRGPNKASVHALQQAAEIGTGTTDQGDATKVQRQHQEAPQVTNLPLKQGWNRVLIKLINQSQEGEIFAFTTHFTDANGKAPHLKTTLSNPEPSKISRAVADRIIPLVNTDAPFNLVYDGEPLTVNVNLGDVNYAMPIKEHGFSRRRNSTMTLSPYLPFSGKLALTVYDYDGKEVISQTQEATFPNTVSFDLGTAPERGYYYTHLELFDEDGNLVTFYQPDGFSVIGGVAAQKQRRDTKKMAVTYYFMARLHETLYFPYMERIGIFRNIGGTNGRALDMYKKAKEDGIILTADLWNRTGEYLDEYVKETAPYVDSYKSYNEIDIHPEQRGTPESWVAKAKAHYDAAKKYDPDALVIGGSLARPGADEWFADCLKLGLGNYQDVWDVHCYPQTAPVLGGSMSNSSRETELGVLMAMEKIGMTNDKPFWIGETGARCSHGYDARPWQAETVAKMVACTLSRPDFEKIGFLIPWHYARAFCGTSDISVAHMPAEAAYYTASALVDGFDSYQQIDLGDSIQSAQFGPTLMLWQKDKVAIDIQFKADTQEPLVLVDVVGRVNDLPTQKDGSIIVSVSQSPIYVLTRKDYESLTAHSVEDELALR